MKKILVLTAGVLLLAGCASGTNTAGEVGTVYYAPDSLVFKQLVEDGRYVTCVWADQLEGSGLSCDWVGYHAEENPE